jgi:hypothetical protein
VAAANVPRLVRVKIRTEYEVVPSRDFLKLALGMVR